MAAKELKDFLDAEIMAVERLLGSLVPHDVFGRMGLEERLERLRGQRQKLEEEPFETAETEGLALLFEGEPVVAAAAIDADFSAKALTQIQDIAAQLNARRSGRELAKAGPIPFRREAKIYITGVKTGSFGFILDEAPGQAEDERNSIRPILQDIAKIIASASESDEALDETGPSLDQRTLSSLKDFFTHLGNSNASLHLMSRSIDRRITNEELQRAALRISQLHITDERVVELRGQLLGILPESRQFEFARHDTNQTLKGRISRQLSHMDLLDIAATLAYKACIGTFLQTRMSRGEYPPKLRFELVAIARDEEAYKDSGPQS